MARSTWDTVAIIGVGLIGGSIGLGLRKGKYARRVIGVVRSLESLRNAQRCKVVDQATRDLASAVGDADLVVVCTPVVDVVNKVKEVALACRADTLITDVASTKENIVAACDYMWGGPRFHGRGTFIGSHPIAGSEKSGPEHAQADLFDDRMVVICPSARARPDLLAKLERFWSSLGARVVQMTAQDHDEALAATSHLPHLVAAVLAASTPLDRLGLVGSGWLDTTRVSSGDVELWKQIFSDNRVRTLRSLERFLGTLQKFRRALERDDVKAMARILKEGKSIRDTVGN